MMRGVLSNKTQRQLLRKFHKEKKRNPKIIEEMLYDHELNVLGQAAGKIKLENILNHSEDSDFGISETSSRKEDTERIINKKLKEMVRSTDKEVVKESEEEIKPISFYLEDE